MTDNIKTVCIFRAEDADMTAFVRHLTDGYFPWKKMEQSVAVFNISLHLATHLARKHGQSCFVFYVNRGEDGMICSHYDSSNRFEAPIRTEQAIPVSLEEDVKHLDALVKARVPIAEIRERYLKTGMAGGMSAYYARQQLYGTQRIYSNEMTSSQQMIVDEIKDKGQCTELSKMKRILTDEEIRRIDEECDALLETHNKKTFSSIEEEIAACQGITIEEFRQMGIRRIKEIYEILNAQKSD